MFRGARGLTLSAIVVLAPVTASAEVPSFDPDQPFRQAFGTHMLRSLLDRAMNALEDHLEITGDLSGSDSQGNRSGRLEFKLYPRGRSRSGAHLKAEGSFFLSPDSGRQDFHLRFQSPREPSDADARAPAESL